MWQRFLRKFTGISRGESTRPRRRHSGLERFARGHLGIFRGLIAVAAAGLMISLFPQERTSEYTGWRAGMVAAHDVKASFTFFVRKNDVELEQDRDLARTNVAPVLRLDPNIGREEQERLMLFLRSWQNPAPGAEEGDSLAFPRGRLSERTLEWLALSEDSVALPLKIAPRVLQRIYGEGTISTEEAHQVRDYFARRERLPVEAREPDRVSLAAADQSEQSIAFSKVLTTHRVRDDLGQMIVAAAAAQRLRLSSDALRALHNLIDVSLVPNLSYDREETLLRQKDASDRVAVNKGTILKNERFIEGNVRLTPRHINELTSMREALKERRRQMVYRGQSVAEWTGRSLLVICVIVAVGLILREFHPELWRRPHWLLLCVLLAWLPLIAASYAGQDPDIPVYMVPLALTAMLSTVLFNAQVGLALSAGTVLIAGAVLGFNYQVVFVNAIACTVAVFAVRNARNRNQFMRAMFYLPLGTVLAIFIVDGIQATALRSVAEHAWPGAVAGVAVPILSMGLLVVFEKTFNITTSITLLELSDLNSPLLRELSIRSPGTYTHSIIIANLVEAAAGAVGADPLLARVGAYYHDIGKMQRPNHFTENQIDGRNPHDKLSPQMSVLVIIAHVKDGIEIAEKVGLPQQIIDFIPQHQGTLLISYFYRKAQELYGEESVREETFRYPGPKPQTKEAAILMMADAVEAAVRSLRDKTPSRVKGMVRQLVKQRLDDGQFDECALTLRDLALIEDAFLPVLGGALHQRIEYPKPSVAPTPSPNAQHTGRG